MLTMVVWITKADGSKEPFKVNKIKRTARRAGASPKLASDIVREVARVVHDGMTSREILSMILRLLRQEEPSIACRYDLKASIMRLGLAGFNFEQLMAEILREYGFDVSTNQMIKGFCVSHEIDIIAKKDGRSFLVECKYHHLPGAYTGIKETLYTWARLQDLQRAQPSGKAQVKEQGGGSNPGFDGAWLVTNTKFSPDSLQYGKCQGLRLMGWNVPKEGSVSQLITEKGLFPVTVLSVDQSVLMRLAKNKLLLLKDLAGMDAGALARIAGISSQKAARMQELALQVCSGS